LPESIWITVSQAISLRSVVVRKSLPRISRITTDEKLDMREEVIGGLLKSSLIPIRKPSYP